MKKSKSIFGVSFLNSNFTAKLVLLGFVSFLFSCQEKIFKITNDNNIHTQKDTIKKKIDWQEGFQLTHDVEKDSIWGKPVKLYVENKNCSQTAIDFYYGNYRPSDEPRTAELLLLVLTDNAELRPFYRWILNKTILIQDGALGEYTGIPARKYAENFPQEFFEYMDYDKSGEKYKDWCGAIEYSGFYEKDNHDNPNFIIQDLIKTMSNNCTNCNSITKKRIEIFAKDCFGNSMK